MVTLDPDARANYAAGFQAGREAAADLAVPAYGRVEALVAEFGARVPVLEARVAMLEAAVDLERAHNAGVGESSQ